MERISELSTPESRNSIDSARLLQDLQYRQREADTESIAGILNPEIKTNASIDDLVSPFCNALFITPYSALANSVNSLSPGKKLMPELKALESEAGQLGSTKWLLQSVSSGLASALLYSACAKSGGKFLGRLGIRHGESAALIASSAAIEGMRDTATGETHFSNMIGGLSMMAAFETGSFLSRGLSSWRLHAARAGTGAIAAAFSTGCSHLSAGKNLNIEDLLAHSVTGATMNLLLPALIHKPALEFRKAQEEISFSKAARVVEDNSAPETSCKSARSLPKNNNLLSTGTEIKRYWVGAPADLPIRNYRQYLEDHAEHKVIKTNNWKVEPFDLSIKYPSLEADYARLPLERISSAIAELPAPNELQSITVLDHPHFQERWFAKVHGSEKYRVWGDVDKDGNVTLYKPDSEIQLLKTLQHEFAHRLKTKYPVESAIYDEIDSKNPVKLPNKELRDLNGKDESWAHFAEVLLAEKEALAYFTAYQNPAHATIIGSALSRALASNPHAASAGAHNSYTKLLSYIEKSLKPRAIANLNASGETELAKVISKLNLNEHD